MKLWVKIAGALLGIALVTTFALAYLLVDEQGEQLTNSARELRQATADTVVLQVETFFEQVKRELGDLGALISDASQSQEQRVAAVRSKLAGARLLDRVEVFDPDGAYVMGLHAKGAASPRPKALAETIRKHLAAQPLPHVAEHPQPKAPHLMVTAAVKTRDKRLYGYLRARVSLEPLIVDVRELAARRFERSSASEIAIVDSKHRLLVHRDSQRIGKQVPAGVLRPPNPKQFTRNISEAADFGQGDKRRVAVIVPAQSVRWGIIVQQSYDDVYKSVAAAWRKAASIAGVVALLAILGGLLIGRRIGKPVSRLADAAAQIASGDFSARVQPRSADEVGALTRSFNSMAGSLEESRDRLIAEARVRGDMSRYLSDALVDAIVNDPTAIELGGRRAKVTVLFADVVAFTPLAERHAPEDVVRLLNELFTFLTGIVFNHGGMVDKFIGDCVMAVFGVPEQHDDDAERAALAALEMTEWLETGNAKWAAEFGRELQLGIGINTGTAIVGNLGSEKRMEFTAIGDTVNIAARLEMLAKPGQILISEATRAELGDDFEAVDLGLRDITGRKEQIRIFDLQEEA